MTNEEFKAKTAEIIANLNDQAKVTEILVELNEDFATSSLTFSEMTTVKEKLTEDNEKLRNANMNLFLKIGETPATPKDVLPEVLPIDNLFNENGDLL